MLVLIRGAGDIATGIALRLHRSGLQVVMTDLPRPTAIRRTVCFSPAITDGETTVEGVRAVYAPDAAAAKKYLSQGAVPVLADPELRLRRICARDGISEADARQRMAAQQSDEYYADGATAIFHNNGDMAALEKALHSAISGLRLEWRRYAR